MRFRLSVFLPAAAAALTAVAAADFLRAQAPPQPVPAQRAAAVAQDEPKTDAAVSAEDSAKLAIDQKLIAEAKDHSEIMKNLTYISDIIGPRLTGSAALEKANRWTADKMKEYGLENVHLEPWTIPLGWERGTASMKIIEPDNGKSLIVASWAWAPGTKGPIEGDIVIFQPRSTEDLAKYKGKLKNAIILQQPPQTLPESITNFVNPQGRRGGGRGGEKGGDKGGDKAAGKGRGGRGFAGGGFAAEAAAFLRAEGAACTLRDSAKPHGLLTMSGGWPRPGRGGNADRASAGEPLPNLVVANDHYRLLWRLASRPDAKTRAVVEVTNKFIPGPITCYNTVGEIRGSEKPDEFVVCGAHLDSWDLGQGTTDNGTGSCVVLETARLLAKSAKEGNRPKRTIRFILFTGEEQGLHGSAQYVRAHEAEMAKTTVALVHDTGTGKITSIGSGGITAIRTVFEKELLPSLKPVGLNSIGTASWGGGGSDHASFGRSGVPGILFTQDRDEYQLTHHTQSDTLDKAREPNLIQGAQVMSVAAMRVANLPNLLPRE